MSKMTRKDFITIAKVIKEVINTLDEYSANKTKEIIVRRFDTEFSNFDKTKFLRFIEKGL